ncbi:Cysteine protease atg4 [Ceratocystis pirilliformis]|uniref:Cysteine protease n=1 Tax=Ceratocystis pirilliformis TaxID=259994 RepID=A0ABR3ZJF8_9PEZI
MSIVDISKRIIQSLWDPEPTNDRLQNVPVWCLGCSYDLSSAKAPPIKPPPHTAAKYTATIVLDTSSAGGSASPENVLEEDNLDNIEAAEDIENASDDLVETATSDLPVAKTESPDGGWPVEFLDDFESRLWMTYRSNFQTILKSSDPGAIGALSLSVRIKSQFSDQNGFTSDSGWGCMIRTGQSLLANTMAIHALGRGWRLGHYDHAERSIISKFADDPEAPYSIHNFVKHGAEACGKYPGEWFGPSATARCIQSLVNERELDLRVYSTGDSADVYEDRFMQVAKPDGIKFIPTLVLVTTRLGIDKITTVYWEALVATLQMQQSVGIAGGRPSSSYYFIGVQGMFLYYLDPHVTQPALQFHKDVSEYEHGELSTCHTRRLRKLHLKEMDPSMLIGFFIRSEDEWREWRAGVKHVQGRPVISVFDRNPLGDVNERAEAIDEVESMSEADGLEDDD